MRPEMTPGRFTEQIERCLEEGRLTDAEALAHRLLADPVLHGRAVTVLARCATARQDYDEALRWVDRLARRAAPGAAGGIDVLRGVILLAADRPQEAVRRLEPVWEASAPATAGVALVQALFQVGEVARAARVAAALLRRASVGGFPALARLADRIVAADRAVGWVGHDGGNRLRGALRPAIAPLAVLTIRNNADPSAPPLLRMPAGAFLERFGERFGPEGAGDGLPHPFAIELASADAPLDVAIDVNQSVLLGSPLSLPFRPGVEGVVELEGTLLRGWVRLPDEPARRLMVTVMDEAGRSLRILADQPCELPRPPDMDDERYGFSVEPAAMNARPGLLRVTAGPDDAPLIGSPVRLVDRLAAGVGLASITGWLKRGGPPFPLPAGPSAVQALAAALSALPIPVERQPPPRPFAQPSGPPAAERRVDVIVPVYRGRADTLACLRSVLENRDGLTGDVLVVDDATPEPALAGDLAALAAAGRITLLTNKRNLGFPASVNRGMAEHPDRDVVLLNADTLVAGDWLVRLRAAAYRAPDLGTATPLSNDAEILSYPSGAGGAGEPAPPVPDAAGSAALDRLAARVNAGCTVEIPTAVGFCMYIRRDCLDEVGPFDTERFDRGYGEENDFCLRARRLGWRHVAAADVFVAHVGGQSFGRRKALLQARNGRILNRLHPGYDALVADFIRTDPLAAARCRLDLARWPAPAAPAARPAVLIVTLGRTGGVARHVAERGRALAQAGRRVLVLLPVPAVAGTAARCRIGDLDNPGLRDLVFRTREEIDVLAAVLAAAGVREVEFHHTLDHDPVVLELPRRLGVPYAVVVHDYSWVCPRITLADGMDRYCGEPDEASCERCVRENGSLTGEDITVADLRRRSAAVMAEAVRVVAPSVGVAESLMRHAPSAALAVIPWDEVAPPPPVRHARAAGTRWRVCLIGAIGTHKGYGVLLDCARDAAVRRLPIEFVVVGHTQDDHALFATGRVFVTGRYEDHEDGAALVKAQRAHLAFFPMLCPETWCYSLSLAWQAGLEAAAFDLGAVAERMRRGGGGLLLPPGLAAGAVNQRLISFLTGEEPLT